MDKVKINDRTHLREEEPYSYQLQDVKEPNLMRDVQAVRTERDHPAD